MVISLLLLVFEVAANSPLSIGQFNYFFLAFIALAIYFNLSKFFKVESSFWALFFFSLLFGLIPIIIQIAVAGTVHVDQLTTTIYWLIGISSGFALISIIVNIFFKLFKSSLSRILTEIFISIFMAIPAGLSLSFFAYYLLSNSVLSGDTSLAIAQTNTSEAFAYLNENPSSKAVLFFLLSSFSLSFY